MNWPSNQRQQWFHYCGKCWEPSEASSRISTASSLLSWRLSSCHLWGLFRKCHPSAARIMTGSAAQCPVLGDLTLTRRKKSTAFFVLGSCSTASKYGFIEYYSNRTRLYGNVRKTSNSFHGKFSVKASVSLHLCCAVSRIPLLKSSATSATLSSSQGVFLPEVFRAGLCRMHSARACWASAGYHWTVGSFGNFWQPRDSRVTLSASQSWRFTTAGPLWTRNRCHSESIRHYQTWWIVKHHQLISISTIYNTTIYYIYIILRIDHHETDQKSFVACILLALALSSMAASLATSTAALLAGCPSTRICPSPWSVPELVPKQGPLRVGFKAATCIAHGLISAAKAKPSGGKVTWKLVGTGWSWLIFDMLSLLSLSTTGPCRSRKGNEACTWHTELQGDLPAANSSWVAHCG